MKLPHGRVLALNEDVLPEQINDPDRLAVWVPGARADGFQHWERISNVARSAIAREQGLAVTAANVIRARQRLQGFLGKMLQRLRKASGDPTWMLPNGQSAEQTGTRQTDVMLVWSEDAAAPLDEQTVRERWPKCSAVKGLGTNLFAVYGVVSQAAQSEAIQLPATENPREAAEQLLSAADKASDHGKRATALTDLGVTHLREGNFARAATLLEEALKIAQQMQDPTRERDVLGNLGLALGGTQPQRSLELFERELSLSREAGDRFGEKNALNNLGLYYASFRDPLRAYPYFEQAVGLARAVGDRPHEADLLWQMAILHAELGQRDHLMVQAQAAIDLLTSLGKPQAQTLKEHLQKYLDADSAQGALGGMTSGRAGAVGGDAFISGAWSQGNAAPSSATSGPGLLRMAFSATKAMARFLGSGMKRVSPAFHQKRLRTCVTCEHHTGVRCKVCGCFTNVKAWLPYEDCPISKWPKV